MDDENTHDERERERQQLIDRIDAGETVLPSGEAVELKVKQPLDKVVPIRLSDAHWKQLVAEARDLDIGPTTLMRIWVLERLREVRRVGQSA